MGRRGYAANEDGADRLNPSGDFHGHNAAERETREDEGLCSIDLVGEATGVIAYCFVIRRGDPMNIVGLVSFWQTYMSKYPMVCADARDEIDVHGWKFSEFSISDANGIK